MTAVAVAADGTRTYRDGSGALVRVRPDVPAVFVARDLRFFVERPGGPLGMSVAQVDEDGQRRLYERVTSRLWRIIRHRHAAAAIAPIREALAEVHGEAAVAAVERGA
jgi:hypothetical protein